MNPLHDESGEAIKCAVLIALEANRLGVIHEVRRRFVALLLQFGFATVEAARNGFTIPDGVNPSCLGAVPGALARAGIIERARYVNATRRAAHHRTLTEWQLADPSKARAWLQSQPERATPATGQTELPFAGNETPGRGNAPVQ